MASPIRLWNVDQSQLDIDERLLGTNHGRYEGMHLLSTCMRRSDNKHVSQLQKVFRMKGHLGAKTLEGFNPSDLDAVLVNILYNHPIQVLFRQHEVTSNI